MGTETPASRSDRARSSLPPHRWTRVEVPEGEAVVAAHATIIAGAGPAGLTAAYELTRHGSSCVVLESEPVLVGGISRTDVSTKGYRFDIGGHRFFSKSAEINRIWRRDPRRRPVPSPVKRLSRIYYNHTVLPLPAPARRRLPEARARSEPVLASLPATPQGETLADHATRAELTRTGSSTASAAMLFNTFFKTYTEKVWGMSDLRRSRPTGRRSGSKD